MTQIPTITEARRVASDRLETRVLFAGPEDGVPVIFVHGNLSAATWWEETMLRLPEGYRAIAPDLRAYGEADPAAKVDATRGMRDFSDDLAALMDALGVTGAHMVGHSLGGAVLWQMLADHPERVLSLTQVCPGAPQGFGGCKLDGTPCFPDNAGSGGGAVNPDLIALMKAQDRGDETPNHMRNVLNAFVWKPPFVPERIEDILTSALAQHVGEADYPGDMVTSDNWPGVAPGKLGPINALAPIHQADPLGFTTSGAMVPILWLRGADDQVVADGGRAEHRATLAAQRLGQRHRHHHVRLTGQAHFVQQAPTTGAPHPQAVRLVDDHQGTVAATHVVQLAQRRQIAIGGEDRVGHDDGTLLGTVGQCVGDRGNIGVWGHHDTGAGQPAGVDQRRVGQCVGDHQRSLARQRHHGTQVGRVARGEHQR